MGWLWSSSPPSSTSSASTQNGSPTNQDESQGRGFALTEEQRMRIFGKLGAQPRESPSKRDEQADAELDAFIQSFSSPESGSGIATPEMVDAQKQAAAEGGAAQRTNHDRILPDGSLNIHPSAIHPRTMSCRAAFDQAFYCQSLGGKFNDVYRYGQLKDCSEQWGAFWFCMRIRTYPEHEKQEKIREYYEDREERKRKTYGSSEDVWALREKVVEKAFWKDPDADDDLQQQLVKR